MLKQNTNTALKRRIIWLEIFLTVGLLLLARYIELNQKPIIDSTETSNFFHNRIINLQDNQRNDPFRQQQTK